MTSPKRPVLRWHGGKWLLAPWIIGHFPKHRVYVEPFGGAASVLLRKERAYAEVYNDLDDEVVNLFQVLRSEQANRLVHELRMTPFARAEFERAYEWADEPVERARRLIIRSFMGHGSDGAHSPYRTGFRANSNKSGTTPARDWINLPSAYSAIIERFSGCIIEHSDAVKVMRQHDSPQTLHYVDPPYVHATRSRSGRQPGARTVAVYAHEMNDADHERLLDALRDLAGMVVLSGYPSPLYDDAIADWRRVERKALADGARERTEVLWINAACASRLDSHASGAGSPLFAEVLT